MSSKQIPDAEMAVSSAGDSAPAKSSTGGGVRTLLDDVLEQSAAGAAGVSRLDQFLAASHVGEALDLWFADRQSLDKEQIARFLNTDIATIDAAVAEQLNGLLHHPAFQKLEASYRGLRYLVDCAAATNHGLIKVKMLNWSWRELARDFDRATEFDQSQLFRKVYESEFGTAGGEPIGVLIGDYQIHPRPSDDHPIDDLAALTGAAQVASAAFCPFLTGVHPSMFGLNDFDELERVENIERGFDQPEFVKWRAFRDTDDSRFVGLVLPRVLMRQPYQRSSLTPHGFCFDEDVHGKDQSKYLWGNAAFAMGEVLIRAFANYGWLSEIRGVTRNTETGGLVLRLPVHHFATDRPGIAPKSSTETVITESLESKLSAQGFISLCHCYDTEYSAFYTCPSVQKPKVYDRDAATQNAKISSMLHYMFCVSRFAHYLKILARDRIGSFAEPEDTARSLRDWLMNYVTPDDSASMEAKARRPLRDADIQVRAEPGMPGQFLCTFRLSPHYQFDNINASIQLRTRVTDGAAS